MTEPRVRVAFIAGAARSGSTLLEQMLREIDGVVTAGELFWLWTDFWPGMVCECGNEFRACEFWTAVLDEAFGTEQTQLRTRVRELSSQALRFRFAPMLGAPWSGRKLATDVAKIGMLLERTYRAIAIVSGASVVVDATKLPLFGIAGSVAQGIDLRVVHLVRNPQAVAFSWTRSVSNPATGGLPMKTLSPSRAALSWLIANFEAEMLKRRASPSVLLLYGELARQPQAATKRLSELLSIDVELENLFSGRTLRTTVFGHAIAGNPMRASVGPIVIAPDEAWRTSSPRSDRLVTSLATGPLWHWYVRAATRDLARRSSAVQSANSDAPSTIDAADMG